MKIIEKMTRKSQASDQVVKMMVTLVILINMTMKIMEMIYHLISFYIVFLSFG